MNKPLWMWVSFITLIVILLMFDLGVFHRKKHVIGIKESLWMSAFYIFMAFLFGLAIWHFLNAQSFAEYLTGFLIEKSLALDNMFVISLIFSSLSIPRQYQHRVLFAGIIGVIIFRAILIGVGANLIHQFSWLLYIFAVFMIFTGIHMFFTFEKKIDIQNNLLLQWMRKHIKITEKLHGQKFFVRLSQAGRKKKIIFITPLLVALILIEALDLIFAIDSIPAIFAVTTDSYIVYTSNIFAILGLRALYFALSSIIKRFYYLKFSLAAVLIFIGSKIFIADFMGLEKFPPMISLGMTFSLLTFGCVYSLYKSK